MADNPISITSIDAYKKTLSQQELERFNQLPPAQQQEKVSVFLSNTTPVSGSSTIFAANIQPMPGLSLESSSTNSSSSSNDIHQQTIDILKNHLAEMKDFFKNKNGKNGYITQLGDAIKGLWNKDNTRGAVTEQINALENKIKLLEDAQKGAATDSEGKPLSFENAFAKTFGQPFDKDKINKFLQTQKSYQQSKEYQAAYDKYSDALSPLIAQADDPKRQGATGENVTKLESAITSLIGQEGLNKIYKENNINSDSSPKEEKYKILIAQAKQLLAKSSSDLLNVSQGHTVQALSFESETAYEEATGDDLKDKIANQAQKSKSAAGIAGSLVRSGVTIVTGILPGAVAETGVGAVDRFTDNSGDSIGTKLADTGEDLLGNVNPLPSLDSLRTLGQVLGLVKEKPKYQYILSQLQPFILENDKNQGKLENPQSVEKLEQALNALEDKDKLQDFYKKQGINPAQLTPEEKYRLLINYSRELLATKKNED